MQATQRLGGSLNIYGYTGSAQEMLFRKHLILNTASNLTFFKKMLGRIGKPVPGSFSYLFPTEVGEISLVLVQPCPKPEASVLQLSCAH